MTATNGNTNGAVNGHARKDHGRRLLTQVVDDIAHTDPERECFAIPRSSDPKDGWKTVTFKQYANAINHVAHQINANCGPPPAGTFPTIAYIGPNDARYIIMILAAVKAGYQVRYAIHPSIHTCLSVAFHCVERYRKQQHILTVEAGVVHAR